MGARSWCERRSQPPPQSHHHRHSQQEAHLQSGQHREEIANYQRPGAAPSPGPAEYRRQEQALLDAHLPEKLANKPTRTNSPPPPFETSAMYTASTVKERERLELGLLRDRRVRLNSVRADILLDLPPSIALPDGEERRDVRLIRLRDAEQESEIYRGYIRPPPNRTVLEKGQPPPPYASAASAMVGTDAALPTEGDARAVKNGARRQRGSARRYGDPPSYERVAGDRAAKGEGPARADDEARLLGDYDPEDEYSDSPPSYSDVVASSADDFDEAPLIGRRRIDHV